MRPIIFLLLIQIGYIKSKTIDFVNLCNESPETDPRLKRSEENDTESSFYESSDLEDSSIIKPTNTVNNGTSELIANNNIVADATENVSNENNDEKVNQDSDSNKSISNDNDPSHDIFLIHNELTNSLNISNGHNTNNNLNIYKDKRTQQPIIIQTIDPKFIITSKPYYQTNATRTDQVDKNKIEEPLTINLIETIPIVSNKNPENLLELVNNTNAGIEDTNKETVESELLFNDTDISNIRELRKLLLDHLLDYFINIIKDEEIIHNETRKKSGKDKMNLEEKLRNYYDPQHLDLFFDENEDSGDNFDDTYFRRRYNSELINVDQNTELNTENNKDIESFNANLDRNKKQPHYSSEYLQYINMVSNVEDKNDRKANPNLENFYDDQPEHIGTDSKNIVTRHNNEYAATVGTPQILTTVTTPTSSVETLTNNPLEDIEEPGGQATEKYYDEIIDSVEYQEDLIKTTDQTETKDKNLLTDESDKGNDNMTEIKNAMIQNTSVDNIKIFNNDKLVNISNSTTKLSSQNDNNKIVILYDKNVLSVNKSNPKNKLKDSIQTNKLKVVENTNDQSNKEKCNNITKDKSTNKECNKNIVLNLNINFNK